MLTYVKNIIFTNVIMSIELWFCSTEGSESIYQAAMFDIILR